jgi:hypothetical protein
MTTTVVTKRYVPVFSTLCPRFFSATTRPGVGKWVWSGNGSGTDSSLHLAILGLVRRSAGRRTRPPRPDPARTGRPTHPSPSGTRPIPPARPSAVRRAGLDGAADRLGRRRPAADPHRTGDQPGPADGSAGPVISGRAGPRAILVGIKGVRSRFLGDLWLLTPLDH